MSAHHDDDRKLFRSARVDDILKAAHRERAEAIRQLFGFGFGVVAEKAKSLSDTEIGSNLAARAAVRGA